MGYRALARFHPTEAPPGLSGALLAGAILALSSPTVFAQTDSWTDTNGNWNTAGNWSTGVPTSSDAVFITVSGGYTITYNTGTSTVGSLTISNSNILDVTGGSLTITGAYTGTGPTTTVTGGILALDSASTLDTLNVASSGVLSGTGSV
jgi:hypothetical protein